MSSLEHMEAAVRRNTAAWTTCFPFVSALYDSEVVSISFPHHLSSTRFTVETRFSDSVCHLKLYRNMRHDITAASAVFDAVQSQPSPALTKLSVTSRDYDGKGSPNEMKGPRHFCWAGSLLGFGRMV